MGRTQLKIIKEDCDPSVDNNRDLPNNAFLVTYKVDGKEQHDLVIAAKQIEIFDTYYDTESKLYLGEDFAFSRLWTKIGGKCMALITEYITHVGEHQFTGRLIDEMVAMGVDSQQK